jgi:hypothetical protein
MKTVVTLAAAITVAAVAILPASTAAPDPGDATIATSPIECWWRTTAAAVRVGEPFLFVLTCSVVENDSVTVIPDQSALAPSVVQMPPFEVIGGAHGPDLRTDDRRFFQYEYRLRLIGDDLFGKDVSLPAMKISYRVQSRIAQGASLEGRDRVYVLPSESIRVLALVPSDATAIREGLPERFVDIDAQLFRANLLLVVAGILLALAALLGVLLLVKVAGRHRARTPVAHGLVSQPTVLRAIGRELSEIERLREQSGWTRELAGRALAAARIAASLAVARPIIQTAAGAATDASSEGCLRVRAGWPHAREVLVAAIVTGEAVAQELKRARAMTADGDGQGSLEGVGPALTHLSLVWYAPDEAFDEQALDESLASGRRLHQRLARQNSWMARRVAALKRAAVPQRAAVWKP